MESSLSLVDVSGDFSLDTSMNVVRGNGTMFGIRTRLINAFNQARVRRELPKELRRRLTLSELVRLDLSRTEAYCYCHYFFRQFLPPEIQRHRAFFSKSSRGFGEDAFHALWFLVFEEIRPAHALEIGVYRGQTISLWKLLARHFGYSCEVSCISPFVSAGDAVSRYATGIDYEADTRANHAAFGLEMPNMFKGYSTSPGAKEMILGRLWDCIYIDGNHDYEVAQEDWLCCSKALASRGVIVLDDSALDTDFEPPAFATKGHPGPTQVAREIGADFYEMLGVGHNRLFARA